MAQWRLWRLLGDKGRTGEKCDNAAGVGAVCSLRGIAGDVY